MIFASTLLAALLMLTSCVKPMAATDGHYSVNLRFSALTPESVRTTVILNGVEKSATVSAHTTDLTLEYTMSSDQVLDNKPILLEVSVLAGANFETKTLELDRASPRVHSVNDLVRIVAGKSECAKNYYGPFCSLYCAANEALHWTCSSEGVLGCAEGWQGPKCAERACPVACVHGHCDNGAVCRCRPGFAGPACDQCIPAAGCLSGACRNNTPGTCGGCADGWAGPLCNIDLSLCSAKKSPCAVGSICIVKAPGKTACICPEGKTGSNCDVDAVARPCPCKNGGRCSPLSIRTPSAVCQCPLGFTGPHCETIAVTTTVTRGGETNQSAIAHNNLLVVMNVILCLVVLLIGTVLITLALRFINSSASGACGRPSSSSSSRSEESTRTDENRKKEEKPMQKLSTVSLLMPEDLTTLPPSYSAACTPYSTPSHSSKGDAEKTVVFDTVDEPRYSTCPKKSTVFSIPEPEKTYESLPV